MFFEEELPEVVIRYLEARELSRASSRAKAVQMSEELATLSIEDLLVAQWQASQDLQGSGPQPGQGCVRAAVRRKRLSEGPDRRQPRDGGQQQGRKLAVGAGDRGSPATDEDTRRHPIEVVATVIGAEAEVVSPASVAHHSRVARIGPEENHPRTHGAGERAERQG